MSKAPALLALLPLPKAEDTFKLPLEQQEVQALLDVCDTQTVWGSRDLAILLTYLDGGLRVMDLAYLQVGEVNLEMGTLFIAAGKGRKSRNVTIGEHTKRMLRRYAFLRAAPRGKGTCPHHRLHPLHPTLGLGWRPHSGAGGAAVFGYRH
jgi:site-specific recombinase XerD